MDPSTIVQESVAASQVTGQFAHDPVFVGLAWVVGIVALVIAIGKPIRDYVRSEKKASKEDIADAAKATAEATLYEHLAQQVSEYRRLADLSLTERVELNQRIGVLEGQLKQMEDMHGVMGRMRIKLDEKDEVIQRLLKEAKEERDQFRRTISKKDQDLIDKDQRIYKLELALKDLESRLNSDEATMIRLRCPIISEEIEKRNLVGKALGLMVEPVSVRHDCGTDCGD